MRRVILLIESARACEQRFIRGVIKYSQLHGPWVFYRKPKYYIKPNRQAATVGQLKQWRADGIIVSDTENINSIIAMDLPTIVHTIKKRSYKLPSIIGDCEKSGIWAAEHLLDRGFQNFAFCGVDNFYWSQERFKSFHNRLRAAGYEPQFYKQKSSRIRRSFDAEQDLLAKWLKSLAKPTGLMACADDCGQNVIEACELAGINVPEEIAVIGVDNDEMVCELSSPALSSVALDFEKAGFDAAELLDKLMAGKNAVNQTITVEPIHVASRQSTDILAIDDSDVVQAVRYIRHNSKRLIQVSDVLNEVGCSRRNLHRKFQHILGRSVHKEIKRIRIETICQMLLETDLPILQIALTLGYQSSDHIARFFKQETGMTPLAYRKKYAKH